jgi:hypothetical protein
MTKKLTAWDKAEQQYLAGMRDTILWSGESKFGPPSKEIVAQINQVDDPERLEQIAVRILKVSTWVELFVVPEP